MYDLMPNEWRESARGVLVALPVILFPFSRIYTAGFIILLFVAVFDCGWPIQWSWQFEAEAPARRLLWGVLAIAGPVFITCLVLPLSGMGFELLWLRNLLTILTAGLFGLATCRVLNTAPRVRQVAVALIAATIIFWLLDGLVQFGFGKDLFGVPSQENGRLGIFFSNSKTFGYFIPFFSVFPAFWCFQWKRGPLLSVLVIIAGGIVTLASGSRFGMLSFGLFVAVYALLAVRAMPRRRRSAIFFSVPFFTALFAYTVFRANTSFQARLAQSLSVIQDPTFKGLDYALSHRLEIWQHSWSLIKSSPLFGIGLGEFRPAVALLLRPDGIYYQRGVEILHAHQVLLEIALGAGLVGVVAFLIYYHHIFMLFWSFRFTWGEPVSGAGLAGLLIFLLLWFPLGTHKNFYGSEQLFFTFYFLALGFALLQSRNPDLQEDYPACTSNCGG